MWRRVLHHEARDAEPDGLGHFGVLDRRRQQDARAGQSRIGELLEKGQTAHARHAQVEDEHVRLLVRDRRHRGVGVRTRGDHREVRLPLQELLESVEHDGMVVDQNQPHAH